MHVYKVGLGLGRCTCIRFAKCHVGAHVLDMLRFR